MNRNRQLVYRLLGLPHVHREQIARQFGLDDSSDGDLDESARWGRRLRRADERGIIPNVWDAIVAKETM